MNAGLLPNLAKLREQGIFSPLTTTNPPETAAAWASFATGQNPGKTGVFDFVTREPETYAILPAMVSLTRRAGDASGRFRSAVHGTSMWKVLGNQGLHSTVLSLPVTWPPERFNGNLLTGMGTPDLLGTAGRAAFFTTAITKPRPRFNVRELAITVDDGEVVTTLTGPQDVTIPLRFTVDPAAGRARAFLPDSCVDLVRGRLSDWCEVSFVVDGREIAGLCRFCLLSTEPELEIYCSPLQPHPRQPHVPISVPPSFAGELFQALGPYRTQGREVDIFGLLEDVITEEALVHDTFVAMEERERMTMHVLETGASDLVISWFGVVDTTQHGFWRFIDPHHPLHTPEGEQRYGNTIRLVYQWLDGMVGRMVQALDDETLLLIVSDHGCVSWRRSVHLNTWLWQQGFLALGKGESAAPVPPVPVQDQGGPAVPFSNVDWTRTQAYAVGCGKIYLNLQGREGQGIVALGVEAEAVEEAVIAGLGAWRDPAAGGPVVSQVYRSRDVQWGPLMPRAPELIVGLERGYRIAWSSMSQISLGEPIVANTGKISGDHISVDYRLVPATLFSNIPLGLGQADPHIMDIAPTVLEYLGVPIPDEIDGRSLWSGRTGS
jgi:predicted AlkP superfamily phosphohydrolase/phosphomutase